MTMRTIAFVTVSALAISSLLAPSAWALTKLNPKVVPDLPNLNLRNIPDLNPNTVPNNPAAPGLRNVPDPPSPPNYGQLPGPARPDVPMYDSPQTPLGDGPSLNYGNLGSEAPPLNYGNLGPEAPNAPMGLLPQRPLPAIPGEAVFPRPDFRPPPVKQNQFGKVPDANYGGLPAAPPAFAPKKNPVTALGDQLGIDPAVIARNQRNRVGVIDMPPAQRAKLPSPVAIFGQEPPIAPAQAAAKGMSKATKAATGVSVSLLVLAAAGISAPFIAGEINGEDVPGQVARELGLPSGDAEN